MQVTVLIEGLDVHPWVVQARLLDAGFDADVQVECRSEEEGHVAVARVRLWKGRDVTSALADLGSGAGAHLARFLEYVRKHAYGAQVVVAEPGADDVDAEAHLTPRELSAQFPSLITPEGVVVFIPTRSKWDSADGRFGQDG